MQNLAAWNDPAGPGPSRGPNGNAPPIYSAQSAQSASPVSPAVGLEAAGVLDALVHDEKNGRLILAMFERRPWTGGDRQLWQLQEKLNAYASFALDGELHEQLPSLAHLPVCLQLRTVHPPSAEALTLLDQVRQQLSFMEITLEIWEIPPDEIPAPNTP